MLTKVIDEQPFQVLTDSFSISPSTTGYELEISADGINYSPLFTVAANTTRLVTNVANGSYYRLKNNSGEVVVNWRTTCKSSGGGGGEGSQGPMGPMGPQGYQGPAGSGSSADFTSLMPVSELPESGETGEVVALSIPHGGGTWEVFDASEHPTKVRILTNNDGTYLLHFDSDNLYTGLDYTAGDPPTFSGEGWGLTQDDTYNWHYDNNGYYISVWAEEEDGDWYIYAEMTQGEGGFSMLDAYELGGGSEMYVDGTAGNIGVYQYDGNDWNEIGVGEGGGVLVVDSLSSSEAANAPVGSLVGQYKKEGTYLETMPVESPDANAEKIVVKGDVNFSNARVQMLLFNGSFYVEFGRSDGKWTKINKGNTTGSWTLDGVDIGGSWTGETDGDVLQLTDDLNWGITFTKQENGDWLGELWGGTNPHFKYITNLTGSNAFRYEAISPTEANLYMKVSGGTVAHWQGYRTTNQTEAFEIIYDDLYDFTTFCDGKIMFSLRYQYGGGTRYAFMDAANQAIVYYSDSAKTTEVARANYLGVPVQFAAETFPSNNYTWVEWKEDGVYFYGKSNYAFIENLINFHTEGVHFVRITDPTKATASDLGLGDNTTNGIPIWNNEGVIVGKTVGYSTKDIQFNTNASKYGYIGKVTFITNGTNNGPERIFAPLSGGTQGQVLVSDGDNAAPVWTNWVKPVKITSAAYEALVTKDPNTLYLIIDE